VATTDQPNEESGAPPPAAATAAGLSDQGAARRRFARIGAGTSAGAITTLASQPAMAALLCKSMSGMLSGNLSKNHQHVLACAGRSPGYWKNRPSAWTATGIAPSAMFQAIFGTSGRTAALNPYSCMKVVTANAFPRSNDPDNLAMHIMATLLNVRSGKISFLTEIQVRGIWNSYSAKGSFQPAAGVTWTGYDIVDYLKKTMD
jgi:hypothetical protein